MHLFHDSTLNTWKLITEKLPEKPKGFKDGYYVSPERDREMDKYYDAIAALKQNALTVRNPEIFVIDRNGTPYAKTHTIMPWASCPMRVTPDELYFWTGSYSIWANGIAMLTLPEEKKNTMENDKIFIDGDFNDSYEARIQGSKSKGKNKNEVATTESSGSVAAPKEGEEFFKIPKIEYSYGDKKELPHCLLREIHETMFYYVKHMHPNQKYTSDYFELSLRATNAVLKYVTPEECPECAIHKAVNSLLAGDEPEVALANEVFKLRQLIEEAFLAGRSQTSWEQFKIDNEL